MDCEFKPSVNVFNLDEYSPRCDSDIRIIPIPKRSQSCSIPYQCGFCGEEATCCKCTVISGYSTCEVMLTKDEFEKHRIYTLRTKKEQTEKNIKELGLNIKELGDNVESFLYLYYIEEIQELQILLKDIKEELRK